MGGGFILVVGPSGAGKDTLLQLAKQELAADPQFVFPRRLVTRSSSVWEEHDSMDLAAFEQGVSNREFTLAWRAHGHGYAIPGSCLKEAADGRFIVCNVSRTVIEAARDRLPDVSVVEITAPREVLAARLAGRGRGDDADLGARLERSQEIPPLNVDLTIVNNQTPQGGARLLINFLLRKVSSAQEA